MASSSSPPIQTLSSHSRSPSDTGYLPPSSFASRAPPPPPSSSRSSSSETDSETSSAYYAREDQLQWDESMRQLKSIVHIVAIPFFGKWAGRKWGYYMYGRYLDLGLGRKFWLGEWGDSLLGRILGR